jgi:dUTPase
MELNEEKSKVMKVNKRGEGSINIQCKGEMLEQVGSYTHLGTVISQEGRIDQEVVNRVQKANKAYFQMNIIIFGKRELEMKTKTRIYQSVIAPILLYGSERWPTQQKHVSRITATEMKCYRKIVGKTKRDRVRSDRIREQVGQESVRRVLRIVRLTFSSNYLLTVDRP